MADATQQAPTRRWWVPVVEWAATLLLIAGGLYLYGLRALPGPMADDAFITLRYAENLAAGQGVVFQPDERVEGYSNFLFLVLVAGAVRIGIEAVQAAHWINVLAVATTAIWILHALPSGIRRSPWRWPAAALFLGSVHTQYNVIGGLEAPLVALLALVAAVAVDARQSRRAALVALGLGLIRPEGIALAAALMVVDIGRSLWLGQAAERRRTALAWCWFMVLPYAVYVAWRVAYFGHLVPNSIGAKMGTPWLVGLRRSLAYMEPAWSTYWPWLALLVAGAWVGVWRARRERLAVSVLAGRYPWATMVLFAAVVGLTVATGAGDPYVRFLRYLLPALPLLAVLVIHASEALRRRPAPVGRQIAVVVLLVALAGFQLFRAVQVRVPPPGPTVERAWVGVDWLLGSPPDPGPPPFRWDMPVLYATAAWMVENTEPDAVLATAEVGIVPYYTGMQVVDTFGLVDRHIADQPGKPGAKSDPDYVFDRDPDYFIFKKHLHCLCGGIDADIELFRDHRFRNGWKLEHAQKDGRRSVLVFGRRDRPLAATELCGEFRDGQVVSDVEPHDGFPGPVRRRHVAEVGPDQERAFDLLQPVARGEAPVDDAAVGWMDDWTAQWTCLLRHQPSVPPVESTFWSRRLALQEQEHATLRFDFGFPHSGSKPGHPTIFRVAVVDEAAGESTEVFTRTVVSSDEAIWHDAEVDLSAYAGRDIELRFRVEQPDGPVGVPPSIHDPAWRNPRVTLGSPADSNLP